MSNNSTGLMSLSRMWVIATHTFTQLSRMKVFYFLVVFGILMVGINFFELPSNSAGSNTTEQHLKMVKNMSMWGMEMFGLIFGIAATALLIPKDVEDRTLYTILCKPVPRVDYLFGKLLGVLLIVGVSILAMDLLLVAVVYFRAHGFEPLGYSGLINSEIFAIKAQYASDGVTDGPQLAKAIAARTSELEALGVTWKLQIGVLAIFLKTVVIASVAMLLSTFSTSTLFTIIMSIIIYSIGMMQSEAIAAQQTMQTSFGDVFAVKSMTTLINVIFPDFQVFSITDSATQSAKDPIKLLIVVKMAILTLIYTTIYTILSWFVFRKKEF